MKINHTGRNIIFMLSACFVAFLAGCKKDDEDANILPSPAMESMHLTSDFSMSRIVHGQMRMGDWKKSARELSVFMDEPGIRQAVGISA